MPVSVNLQNMFSYSLLLFVSILVISLLAVVVALVVYFSSGRKQGKSAPQKSVSEKAGLVTGKGQLRQKYLSQLGSLENSCRNQQMTAREACQHISRIVRNYVYEMTGEPVQCSTLEELKDAGMPELYAMIKECYAQEFSLEGTCNDIYDTLHRARKVIREWN